MLTGLNRMKLSKTLPPPCHQSRAVKDYQGAESQVENKWTNNLQIFGGFCLFFCSLRKNWPSHLELLWVLLNWGWGSGYKWKIVSYRGHFHSRSCTVKGQAPVIWVLPLPLHFPLRAVKHSRLIPCRVLWGFWTQGLSVSPISLIIVNNLHAASMTFPEFQWVNSNSW